MSALQEITNIVESAGFVIYVGYAPTNAQVPYTVHRPLTVDSLDVALSGSSFGYDYQTALYCAAASVEASFNLATAILASIHGRRVGGTTLTASIGYSGAQVEGHYECQITVQLHQGGI